jgi:hypothetical protein
VSNWLTHMAEKVIWTEVIWTEVPRTLGVAHQGG